MGPDILFLRKKGLLNVYLVSFFAVLSFILYFRSLHNFFVLDDFTFIKAASEGSVSANFHFFPIPLLIYRAWYELFGLDPFPIRILSILLNSFACIAVCNLAYRVIAIFDAESSEEIKLLKSLLCGVMFGILYFHAEAVIYFSELHELLFSLFYLVSLCFYFEYRLNKKTANFVLILIFYALSLFSKESAVTLIACLFLCELILFKCRIRDFLRKYHYLFTITLVFILIRVLYFHRFEKLDYVFSFTALVKEVVKNCVFVFTAFVASLDFSYIRDLYKINDSGFISSFKNVIYVYPEAVAGILISLVIFTIIFFRRDKIISISFVFIFVVISSFVWLTGYERYLYLPSAGFCVMTIHFVFKISFQNKLLKIPAIIVMALFFLYNIFSLTQKEDNWQKAAQISFNTVSQIVSFTKELPSGSEVYFKDLPGDYKGAWILRDGIEQIPEFFVKRNDIKFHYFYEMQPGENTEKNVYVFSYSDGKLFKN